MGTRLNQAQRRGRRSGWFLLALATSLAVSLAACSSSPVNTGGAQPGASQSLDPSTPVRSTDPELTIAYVGLDQAFPDPAQDEFQGYFGDAEFLLHPAAGGLQPWLAEKAERLDLSTWKITMRAGLKYQNGSPVTMEKVKSWLAYELATSGEFGDRFKGATVSVDGPQTVTVHFLTPQAAFDTELSNYTLPFYDAEMAKSVGQDFNKLAGMGIYTGPYQIASITAAQWTYTASPNYWRGKPALDKIVLKNVSDDQAAVKAVQHGEADVYVFANIAMQPVATRTPGLHFNPGASAEYEALGANLAKAPWSDPVVRKALASAFDSAQVAQKGTFGVFPPLKGLFPSSFELAYDWMRYDVDAANKALDAAGYVKGADGVRAKDGVRLEGDLLSYGPQLNALAIPLAEQAKLAGFRLTPKLLDYQVWSAKVHGKEWDLSMQNNENFGINGDLGVSCNIYFAPEGAGVFKGAGDDPQIKAACARLRESHDAATVKEVLAIVQRRNAEQAFVIPVTGRVSSWVTNDTWKSAAPDAFYLPITWQTRAG